MLGHIAARNRVARLRLGVAVTDSGRRNPAVTAQAAATLHLLTRGRAILGIGPGEREGNEPYGVDWSKPVARFEEAMATIRALWDSGGELVNRDSHYFPLRNALFDLPPYRGKWPEIWIGAHGPRMLDATETPISPGSRTGRWTTSNVSTSFGRRRLTSVAIRCPSSPPWACSSSPVAAGTTSMKRWSPK